jgi:hypothetical protein
MVADFDFPILARYIIARYAQWAGDYKHSADLFESVASVELTFEGAHDDFLGEQGDPEDIRDQNNILRQDAAKRYNNILRRIREFERIRSTLPGAGSQMGYAPMILSTVHLRGAVWRPAPREFVMLGYVNDLKWLPELLAAAARLADAQRPQDEARLEEMAGARDLPIFEDLAYAWVVTGNPFLDVDVIDLGLIRARALWTDRELPADFAPIRTRFLELLASLDPQRP